MAASTISPLSPRKKEIVRRFLAEPDVHVADLKNGRADRAYEIRDLARILHVHPVHLGNTVREVTGKSTCFHFEERLVAVSKELLLTTTMTISDIARQLTYDPSNFTKFFRHFTGVNPKDFRRNNQSVAGA